MSCFTIVYAYQAKHMCVFGSMERKNRSSFITQIMETFGLIWGLIIWTVEVFKHHRLLLTQ